MGAGLAAEDLRSLALLAAAASCWSRRALAVRMGPRTSRPSPCPATSRAMPEPLERIEAALVTPGRRRPGRGREAQAGLPLRRQAPVPGPLPRRQGARGDPHGRWTARAASCCWTATRRRCAVFDEAGQRAADHRPRAAPASSCKQPVDVAVDAFRNTYVADEEARRVSSSRRRASSWPRWAARSCASRRALTLDPVGRRARLRRQARRKC